MGMFGWWLNFTIKGAIKLTPRTIRFLSLVGNLNKQFNIKNILKKGKKHRKLRALCLKRSNPQQWPWLQYLRAVWSGVIRCPYLNRCETFTASVLIQLSQRDKTHLNNHFWWIWINTTKTKDHHSIYSNTTSFDRRDI